MERLGGSLSLTILGKMEGADFEGLTWRSFRMSPTVCRGPSFVLATFKLNVDSQESRICEEFVQSLACSTDRISRNHQSLPYSS